MPVGPAADVFPERGIEALRAEDLVAQEPKSEGRPNDRKAPPGPYADPEMKLAK